MGMISRLKDIWYDVKHFFINIFKFRKELASYRAWDHYYINQFAAAMYRDMANHLVEHGNHVGCEITAKRARVIAHLLTHLEPEISGSYSKALEEWWATKKEIELDNGWVSMEFSDSKALRRRLDQERAKHLKICKHRKGLLFKYLRKYHEKIWD